MKTWQDNLLQSGFEQSTSSTCSKQSKC